jgi:hypothetical protein
MPTRRPSVRSSTTTEPVKSPEHNGCMHNPNDEARNVSTAISAKTRVACDTTLVPELRGPWHVASSCVR